MDVHELPCTFTKTFSMKRFFFMCLLSAVICSVQADAGFSISRKHEITVFSFSGINNLGDYKLIQTHVGYYTREGDTRPYAGMGQIVDDDNFTIRIQEGGRHWDESERNIYLNLVEATTGKTVDSLQLYAKDYSMHFKISGVKQDKLQYRTDSTMATYQYLILDEDATAAAYRRNRLIFIACSSLGFILLGWLFVRRKKIVKVQATKNS